MLDAFSAGVLIYTGLVEVRGFCFCFCFLFFVVILSVVFVLLSSCLLTYVIREN